MNNSKISYRTSIPDYGRVIEPTPHPTPRIDGIILTEMFVFP